MLWTVAAAGLLVSCGAATAGGTTPTPSPGRDVVATDSDKGKTIDLHVGDRLQVRLASTYWTVDQGSDQRVLRPSGPMAVSPQISGCVPGGGCGFVIARFDAVGPGSADVTASRTSCGEALRCVGDAGSYRVSVAVSTA